MCLHLILVLKNYNENMIALSWCHFSSTSYAPPHHTHIFSLLLFPYSSVIFSMLLINFCTMIYFWEEANLVQ